MKFQRILGLVVTSVSIVISGVVGCTPQSQTNAQNSQTNTTQVQNNSGTQTQDNGPDVIYVPTPQVVVDEMLALAKVNGEDIIYDLGSGDGRIPITAAKKFGTRGVGIDINPQRIREANENAEKAGVTDKVQFRQEDLFKSDFSEASVVTLYLLPSLNVKLRPKLLSQLKPGTRIVSHDFDMGDWKPERTVKTKEGSNIYLWTVPKNVPANLRS